MSRPGRTVRGEMSHNLCFPSSTRRRRSPRASRSAGTPASDRGASDGFCLAMPVRSHGGDDVSVASRAKVALQDLATWLSRLELALAFLAAALLGALLSALLEIIGGQAPDAVSWFAISLCVCLALTVVAWALARTYSLDLGACFVVRKVQLRNRPAVSARLNRSSRSWLPLEMVDSPEAWSDGVPESVVQLASNLATPLGDSVGRPRVLLALSTSDALGFLLGNLLRPSFLSADVQIMTLPTGSQSWRPARYRIGHRAHRDLFEGNEMSGAACRCDLPKGTGVVDALRSPNHNPEVVLNSLLSQRIICCTQAVYLISADRRTN